MSSKTEDTLEVARMATLSGDYDGALSLIEIFLGQNPDDIDALRLKGNTIELKVLSQMEVSAPASHSTEISNAKACYENILKREPNDLLTLKDIADHYKNFGSKEDAIAYYEKLLKLLRHQESLGSDVADFIDEVLDDYGELRSAG